MNDDKQRAMMAADLRALPYAEWRHLMNVRALAMVAHLADEMSRKARQGWRFDCIEAVALTISRTLFGDDPVGSYRHGLALVGLTPAQIDDAVASIERGEHPADSLPGRVATYRNKAAHEANAHEDLAQASFYDGEAHALGYVLSLLGVSP